jgi:SAM-dependent methyltransferase
LEQGHATKPGLHLVAAPCGICGENDGEPVAVGKDFEYRTSPDTFVTLRCPKCRVVYLSPRPADDEFERIYPANYHAFDFNPEEFGFVYKVRRKLEARRVLKWCKKLPVNAKILDVGCGDGFHLRLLKDYGKPGWKLEGIDADPRAVAVAQKAGIDVRQGQVESLPLELGSYDLILCIMTIEHVGDPAGLLRRIHSLLKPGGRVVIVTDNTGSPDFTIFGGRHWGGYHFPRHWNLFDKQSLRTLAEKTNFEPVRLRTAMSPVNWVYSFRNLLDDWGAPRWIVNCFSLKAAPALALFTCVDSVLNCLGRGATLQAILRRPEVSEDQHP